MRTRFAALIVCLTLALAGLQARQFQVGLLTSSPFESYLESLRVQAGIPGMSAALVQDGQIVWERGFGFQNQEARIRATPDTPYPVADISQTLASALVLECAEERRLSIDDPIRRYGGAVPDQSATVRQVLSHTSAGAGDVFRYDPERYAQLTPVVEQCVPQPYRKTVAVNLLERLAMKDSVPGRDLIDPTVLTERLFSDEVLDRYHKVLERIAVPVQSRQAEARHEDRARTRGDQCRNRTRHHCARFRPLRCRHRRDRAAPSGDARGGLVRRYDRSTSRASDRARMVRPALSRRTCRSGTSGLSRTATRRSS